MTGSGVLVAFAEARRNGGGDSGDIDLVVRRSHDRGETWSPMRAIATVSGDVTCGNPAPVVDRQTGELVVLFTRDNHRLFRTSSTDEDEHFAEPQDITNCLEPMRESFPWFRIATGPCHGVQLATGRLLVPYWMNDKPIEQVHEAAFRCGVMISDDHGRSWRPSEPVPPDVTVLNECSVAELPDGDLLLNIRAQFHGYRYQSRSADGGETWSPPRRCDDLPNPTCQASLLALDDGTLLLSNPPHGGPHAKEQRPPRADLSLFVSRDGGATWSTRTVIQPGPSAYSDLLELPCGEIGVLYEGGERTPTDEIRFRRLPRP